MTWRMRLKNLPWLGHQVERVYRALTGRKDMTFTIADSGKLRADGLMVKIGANDGAIGDPLVQLLPRYPALRCVFVEPVPALLERAKAAWGNDRRFTFVGAVINDTGQDVSFFFVPDEKLARLPALGIDARQVGSLDFAHVAKHLGVPNPQDFIAEITVPGMTINGLLEKTAPDGVEILHIDAEGWDWKILSGLDLCQWRPAFIVFEHLHLTAEDDAAACAFLKPYYSIEIYGSDWLCQRLD
jgi:FkbM family methyltransferase